MSRVEEIEKRREGRKKLLEDKKNEQLAVDLEELDKLEIEHGDENVARINFDRYVEGLPTFAVIKAPSPEYYKRFSSQIRRAGGNVDARAAAAEQLAESVWVYPEDPEMRKRVLDSFPGLKNTAAIAAARLAEGKTEAEGKG